MKLGKIMRLRGLRADFIGGHLPHLLSSGLMIGNTISHYKIVEMLGQGGTGVVYRAEDAKLKRSVALKFLLPHALGNKENRARLIREAQAAASLHHPNICTVYEIDEVDGQTFIVMAHLKGQNLKEKIKEGPLGLDEAVAVSLQVAEGLQEAHRRGIVHRDIKSANIMIGERGHATIMDFSLARLSGRTQITKPGATLGTVAYMSPEQARGDVVDQRTDIWSLGVVIHEMVTRRLPFQGDNDQGVIRSILHDDAESISEARPGVPPALEQVVKKALAKKPNERYETAAALIGDLRRIEKDLKKVKTEARPVTESVTRREGESLVRQLVHRRVPQIVGIYFGASFGILQFVQWLVDRYPISPNLPDFCLALLASMIPTVLVVAYFRGVPQHHAWTRVEKIGIPANILASAALLFVLFQGKDLGATTTMVHTLDEEGKAVKRVVPKSEFRKRIGLFFFENESADSTFDWLGYAIVHLLRYELYQDMYIGWKSVGWSDYGFTDEHKRAGFDRPFAAPLTLKKKIAADAHLNYFVTGSFGKQGDGNLALRAGLYETKRGKLIRERTYSGGDVFKIVDSLSVRLRRDMRVPTYHLEESPDLPVSEIFTNSMDALRMYAIAEAAYAERNDYETAEDGLGRAIELDPTFSAAYWSLYHVFDDLDQYDNELRAIQGAMQHRYRLPQMIQFRVKASYYEANGDTDAYLQNLRQWAALYPHSTDAHVKLAAAYEERNLLDEAIAERKLVLKLDPQRKEELQAIGSDYEAKGEYEKALDYHERYARFYPDRHQSFTKLAAVYQALGDHERAKANLRKALLIEPERVTTLTSLAMVERNLGNFDECMKQCEKALRVAKSAEDSSAAHQAVIDLFAFRGQVSMALEQLEKNYELWKRWVRPGWLIARKAEQMGLYATVGRQNVAFAYLDTAQAQASTPFARALIAFSYLQIFDELDDPRNVGEAEKKLADLESIVESHKLEANRWRVFLGQAMVSRWRGQYAKASESYERAIDLVPKSWRLGTAEYRVSCGSCCRQIGELAKAEEQLRKALKMSPFEPRAHYEIALIFHDMGKHEQALEHLNRALRVWQDADSQYKPAAKARETLAAWKKAGSAVQ